MAHSVAIQPTSHLTRRHRGNEDVVCPQYRVASAFAPLKAAKDDLNFLKEHPRVVSAGMFVTSPINAVKTEVYQSKSHKLASQLTEVKAELKSLGAEKAVRLKLRNPPS